MIYLKDDEFNAISSYIKTNYGVNLTHKRPLIEGRLSNYIAGLGFDSYMDYFEYARKDASGDEMTMLINKLTTNHTYFFRENEHFEFYRDQVLPWVEKGVKTTDLRVWSAGCSSGQEPYTLAMINMEYLGANAGNWDHTILASDISNKVLTIAKNGIYTREELGEVPRSWIQKYFRPCDDQKFAVSERLKKSVTFRNFNLLSHFSFKKPFHCIFCRNVMIYFDMPTKNSIISKFYDALIPGGYFMIGHSESLSSCDHKFKYIKPSIYQKI
ncbi:MAG TPA: protein-glutamate O-methyltransferase CheR [Anaerovoracaceae bacterium]|nr:protein-glutamate O-methyltransferase CheR [Anaerovoracaceae bacterium]